jgi:response regulator NasT
MTALAARAQDIRVAVAADSSGAAAEIARALEDSGCSVRPFSLRVPSAQDRVRELRPAVVLIRTNLRHFGLASTFARAASSGGPGLVLLTPAGSRQAMKLALESGALVHLVEPVAAQALDAGVRIAAARAEDFRRLNEQLVQVRESTQARRAVERAKRVLMRRLGLSEEEAHRRLQRESRNRNRKLAETAWHVIAADARL